MTSKRIGRDARQLALALCLGIPPLVLLLAIGSMVLLRMSDQPRPDTSEPPVSFVCMSDEAGTLLLCERNFSEHPTSEIVLWTAGSMKN